MKRRGWLQRRPLLGFCVLTFAWSWACWCLSAAVKLPAPWLSQVLMLAGGFGPSAAAVAVVWCTRGRAGLRAWLSHCMQWTVGWGWMALAFLAPLVVVSIAAGVHVALGGSIAPSPAAGQVPLAVINLFAVLLVGGPLGEEFGWRGYALPHLQTRMGWRPASLMLGLVWGLWHLPLLFISDTVQAHMTLALFLLSTVAMSVIFAWLALHTRGSVAAALVLHTAINYWPAIVPVLPTPENARPYLLVVVIQVLMAAGLMVWPGHATSGSRWVEAKP
jgi:membrane protease YdiL (CAAX protease family)